MYYIQHLHGPNNVEQQIDRRNNGGKNMSQKKKSKKRATRKRPGSTTLRQTYFRTVPKSHPCGYCGLVRVSYHMDHIKPWSKGGSNGKANLTPCCPSCNLSKSDSTVLQWIRRLPTRKRNRIIAYNKRKRTPLAKIVKHAASRL